MSTLLTPIVAQLDIDRERFKQLVNGGVDDTVQLELRVEKSIAGMVRARITELALDIEAALQQANDSVVQSAAYERESKQNAEDALLYRNQAEGFRNQSQTSRNESNVFRDETKYYHDQIISTAESAINSTAIPFKLTAIHPAEYDEISKFTKNQLHLSAQAFDSNSDRVEWKTRKFKLVKMVAGFDPSVNEVVDAVTGEDPQPANYTVVHESEVRTDSLYLPNQTVTTTDWYAWMFTDKVRKLDVDDLGVYTEYESEWTVFKFDNTLPYINKPTISVTNGKTLTPTVTLSAPVKTNTTSAISYSIYRVYESVTGKVVYEALLTGSVQTHQIPAGALDYGVDYIIKGQYVIDSAAATETVPKRTPVLSPFSNEVAITTELAPSYIPYYQTKSVATTNVIQVAESTVYRVDASANRTLVLSQPTLPSDRAMTLVVFVQGSAGTITWPVEIDWAGGEEPTLGTTWTNVILFWTGSMWIGSEGSKK